MESLTPTPNRPQLSPEQIEALRQIFKLMAHVGIEGADILDGDTDLEETGLEDDFINHEADGPGCPIGDPGDRAAWLERIDQSKSPLPKEGCWADVGNSEDAEDDDGIGEVTEDDPAFDPLSRAIANVLGADGPGGGEMLDSDRDDGDI